MTEKTSFIVAILAMLVAYYLTEENKYAIFTFGGVYTLLLCINFFKNR